MDESLHRLVDTTHRLIDGMLLGAFLTRQTVKRFLDVIHQRLLIEVLIVLAIQIFKSLQLLDIAQSHIGCQIEVESRNRLSAVHLILSTLHRDTSQDRSCLDTLGRARSTMTGDKATVQDVIQRMLHAGERLGGIIVLIVNMEIVVFYGITTLLREQIVIHERLRGL